MRLLFWLLIVSVLASPAYAQSSSRPAPPSHPSAPATQELQTEHIGDAGQAKGNASTQAGFLDPTQIKSLMHRIWLAQYHLTDLLTQVHSERWRVSEATRQSFNQSIDSLRKSTAAEENWRGQFEARPDSLYLGFETYLAMGALLPRLEGVAKGISQYENPSFGGQFSQTANQLFDLRQTLGPHLEYLLKNQDSAMLVIQNNLGSCQNELNFAEHNKEGHATPMKNIVPEFKGRKKTAHPPASK